jgi:hypothetical protein
MIPKNPRYFGCPPAQRRNPWRRIADDNSTSTTPEYSLGLNPVERLWEDLKQRIDVLDAQLRSSLTALQEHVAGIIQRYTAEAMHR